MTNPQWPGGPQNSNPWSQQDPSWTGPQFSDAPGRDPRQPFGAKPQTGPQPSIEDFRHQPNQGSGGNKTLFLIFAMVALIAVVIVALQFTGGTSGPDEEDTAGPKISYEPSAAQTGTNEARFDANGTGTFRLLDHSWNGDQLTVEYEIEVDNGTQSFSLYLFDNETLAPYDPEEYVNVEVSEGEPVQGTATFRMPQNAATLILTTPAGRALTAVHVPGA